MANRYWVGGSGTWDTSSTTHWSASSGGAAGASAPVAGDVVIFDSASSASSYAVTYTATVTRSVSTTINGPASGTLTFTLGAGFLSTSTLVIGSLAQLVVFDTSGSNYAVSPTALTVGTGGTLTCNGSSLSVTTTSITGTLNLNSATLTGSSTFTVNSGGIVNGGSGTINCTTLTLSSGGTINASTAFLAPSSASITGTLNLNNGNITPNSGAGVITVNAGGVITSSGASAINCGALTVATTATLTAGLTLAASTISITGTVNAGSSTFTGTGALTINSGGILNAGSSTMSAGTSTTTTTFNILSGGTLNGGTASISTTGNFSVAGSIATGTHTIYCKAFTVTGTVSAGTAINPTTFTVSAGGSVSGVTTISPTSSVSVSGTLTAGTSITSSTSFSVNSGGTLNAGSATISSGGTFTANAAATINAGTSDITVAGSFFVGGRTFYNVTLSPATAVGYTLTGSNTFNNLTITGNTKTPVNSATSYGINVTAGTTQTISGTLTVTSGTDITYRTYLGVAAVNVSGTYATFNCAAVSLINTDFYGVSITGAAAPASGTNLGDIGDNTGITFPASKTVYWNLAGTQSWTATAWATSSGGTPALNNFPLPQDTAVFNDAGSAGTVTFSTTSNIKNLDFSGRTTAMSFASATGSVRLYLGGNLLLGTTATIVGVFYFINSTSKNLSGYNPNVTTLGLKNYAPLTLLSNVFYLYYYAQLDSAASLNLNGYTLTTDLSYYTFSGNLTFNGGTLVSTGSFFVDPTATTTAGTGTGIIRFTGSADSTFNASGVTFNCTIDCALTGGAYLILYSSGTFNNITNSVSPAAIKFKSGLTYTFNNFNLRGTAGNLVTIVSSTPGNQYTLSKASGVVSSNYLSIQDSVATGGTVWYAGANSVDLGNNTGWLFKSFSSGAMALFLP